MNRDQLLTTATAIFVEVMRYNGFRIWFEPDRDDIANGLVHYRTDVVADIAKQATHMALMLHDAVDTAVNDIPKEE